MEEVVGVRGVTGVLDDPPSLSESSLPLLSVGEKKCKHYKKNLSILSTYIICMLKMSSFATHSSIVLLCVKVVH